MICPDCSAELQGSSCTACAWRVAEAGGLGQYLSSRDRDSSMFSDYRENYDVIAVEDLDESMQPVERLRSAARECVTIVGSVIGQRVCEVGIGQGSLFELLAKGQPEELVGVDISPEYLVRFPTERVIVANAENLPFRNEFDVLVATDILEHVLRPGDFLLSAHRALRAGGKLIIRVPVYESLIPYARLAGCRYEFVHLRAYTPRLLRQELRDAGFEPRKIVKSEHRYGRPRFGRGHRLRSLPGARLWFRPLTVTVLSTRST